MKRLSMLTPFVLFVLTVLGAIASVNASIVLAQAGDQEFRKQLMPYVEADVTPSSHPVVWVSNHEVLFSVEKRGDYFELDGPIRTSHFDRGYYVAHFDSETRQTQKHVDGLLGDRERDGNLIIQIKYVTSNEQWKQGGDPVKKYRQMLVGPYRQEKPVTRYDADIPPPPKKCPTAPPLPEGTTVSNKSFNPEHGCVQGLGAVHKKDPFGRPITQWTERPWVHYRADGSQVELKMASAADMLLPKWIEWLSAYALRDNNAVRTSGSTTNYYLLKHDSRLLTLPMKLTGQHIRPTRAGTVVFRYLPRKPINQAGIYLDRDGDIVQITEGYVFHLEVSPDGCRIAYSTQTIPHRILAAQYFRVINLCTALGVAQGANPYVW